MDIAHFQVIDRIVSIDETSSKAVAVAYVPLQDSLFEGHFPGHAILPGTIQTEIMAQTAGALLWRRFELRRMPFLVGVERARFRVSVCPGAELTCRADLTYVSSGLAVAACVLLEGEIEVSKAEVRLSLGAFPNETALAYAQQACSRLGVFNAEARTLAYLSTGDRP